MKKQNGGLTTIVPSMCHSAQVGLASVVQIYIIRADKV